MRGKRVHILVAEPSLIIRRGILSVLLDIESFGVDVTDIGDISALKADIATHRPDIVVVNPMMLGATSLSDLAGKAKELKFVALQNYMLTGEQTKGYDAIISLIDSRAQIESAMEKLVSSNALRKDDELSAREKEVVTAIALGKSNKEIADALCISSHTVMTHRKNIAAKLKIHNSAGLTIYAIVNKLIDVGDVE